MKNITLNHLPLKYVVFVAIGVTTLLYLTLKQGPKISTLDKRTTVNSPNPTPVFFWCKGILSKRDGKWYLSSDQFSGNGQIMEAPAFPWYSFAHPLAKDMKAFPRYTEEKYDTDGHPYPVGISTSWFGAMCHNAKDFEYYFSLMLTIKQQFGEDPPGQMPSFEGEGFYIVTGP